MIALAWLAFPSACFMLGIVLGGHWQARKTVEAKKLANRLAADFYAANRAAVEAERELFALRKELLASTDARAQAMLKKQVCELAAQLADTKAQLDAARTAFSARRAAASRL